MLGMFDQLEISTFEWPTCLQYLLLPLDLRVLMLLCYVAFVQQDELTNMKHTYTLNLIPLMVI